MVEFWIPEESSGEIVAVNQLEAAPVQSAMARWQTLRDTRRFPREPDAVLETVPHNAILVRVMDEGNDGQG